MPFPVYWSIAAISTHFHPYTTAPVDGPLLSRLTLNSDVKRQRERNAVQSYKNTDIVCSRIVDIQLMIIRKIHQYSHKQEDYLMMRILIAEDDKELRQLFTPVRMITAKDTFDDMRLGFSLGVDDYVVKPINVNEMVLRVRTLLRRAQMINDRRQMIGDTVMECDSLTVMVNGDSIVLPQKEFMLLYKMAAYPGKIFTRQQLMDEMWGYDSESDSHTVDVHIGRLRDRFRDSQDFKIVTICGVGYMVVKL